MKERLLGAAVLIAAAVIVIPSLLDGPRQSQTVSREIALPAPAPEPAAVDPVRTHVVEVVPDVSETDGVIETADEEAAEPPAPPEPVPPRREPAPATGPAQPAAATTPPAPATVAGWAVQVGSFTSETNARRLVEHLKDADYTAFVVRNVVNGRVMFRVRVGPVPDRERAELLAERLQADRQQTQLVRHP